MLRNASTPNALYSTGLEQLGKWLTYEALREWLPYRSQEVETNLGKTEGIVIETGKYTGNKDVKIMWSETGIDTERSDALVVVNEKT